LSDEKLKEFEFILNHTDKSIINLWENILEEARKTTNYKRDNTY
jgi:succinate dehydrogenase flavin-adding protein (antitoxin of CptAB toxin-antitoxin module)